ncbi:MAG: hypothetical protein EOO61_22410, partial [Hymenobacter sp.]
MSFSAYHASATVLYFDSWKQSITWQTVESRQLYEVPLEAFVWNMDLLPPKHWIWTESQQFCHSEDVGWKPTTFSICDDTL